jgi:tetratricopeptide (TPR) repeat protein
MAFGIEKISRRAGTTPVAAGALLLAVCLLWGPITISRGALWQDEAGLWAEAVRYSPNELRARYNLGVALVKAGEQELAGSVFKKALELDPSDDMSHAALGFCAEFRGARLEALKSYGMALSLNPDNEYARRRMDVILEGKMDR